ncbi:hypothetical protein BJ508DRAFT_378518 [Ascobolus immersus RN42]|uniref:CENP-V/GFA domain-containing protein n=1 Tax=Ascobolus immersus RN42 TaxID=1160509 RepID=A0A3N4HWE8_ASCIM|nr:hypothetical protein BJ508DRAFT_378518 [Ascobolus immersus RN42]
MSRPRAPSHPPLPSGSCHCGLIRYTLRTLITPTNTLKCNCSLCVKYGKLAHLLPSPSTDITLLSPLPFGAPLQVIGATAVQETLESRELADVVGSYRFGRGWVTNYFCRRCGVHTFAIGNPREEDGEVGVGVNVNALDGLDASGMEWRCAGYYVDGRRDFEGGVGGRPFEGGRW